MQRGTSHREPELIGECILPPRGQPREAGEENIFKMMEKEPSVLESLRKEKHNMCKRAKD